MLRRLGLVLPFIFSIISLAAQEVADSAWSDTFNLGEVTVSARYINGSTDVVNRRLMKRQGVHSAIDALKLLSGLRITQSGGRNEALVYIRGFDLRQTPVFIDGVPVYVPYDGYVDLNQLLVQDVAYLRVDKGFASLLYGANTMGGAINIISKQPQKTLDLSVGTGTRFSSQGLGAYNGNINVGTKHKKWYVSTSVGWQQQMHANLSAKFDTVPLQRNHQRDNSAFQKLRYGVKAAYTPRATDAYVINVSGIRSSKGVPVYLGHNPYVKVRYWQYPNWDKDGVYFHSRTTLKNKIILKTRWFYDSYYNKLKSFDDANYNSQNFRYTFTSIYNDVSAGGNVEFDVAQVDKHLLKASLQGKYDKHTEFNVGEKHRSMKDFTSTVAVENTWTISPKISLMAGVGYFSRIGIQAQSYFAATNSLGSHHLKNDSEFNYQLAVSFRISDLQSLFAGVARRSRFATMKDRFSYRTGLAVANTNLASEHTFNTEVRYKLNAKNWLVSASVYYNFIDNTIQQVSNVVDDLWQMQNTGRSHFRGFELSADWTVVKHVSYGVAYDFIDMKNLSNPDLYFIDIPEHRISTSLQYEKANAYFIRVIANCESERYSTSDGVYGVPAFVTFDLFVNYYFGCGLQLSASVRNIADKLYHITEGYPEMGRNFSVGLSYMFH